MKHAGPQALAQLEPLLRRLREHDALVERAPGCFYRKSRAYLHFHEDPSGLFADVKFDGAEFARLRVSTAQEQARLLALIASSKTR